MFLAGLQCLELIICICGLPCARCFLAEAYRGALFLAGGFPGWLVESVGHRPNVNKGFIEFCN